MPPQTSPLFRLRLSTLGEDLNSWGDPNLNNALKLLEEGAKGVLSIAVTGDLTLTADNYVSNQYRRGALILTAGTGLAAPFVVTLPPIAVAYRIANQTGFAASIKTAAGAAVTLRAGRQADVLCDGTNCLLPDPTLDKINPAVAAVSLNSQKITGLAAGSADTDAANTKQVNDVIAAVAANANAAQTSASNASTSATQAAASAARLSGTSSTSNAISTGSQAFTTQSGKFFDAGNWLKISSAANPTNYFHGVSTAYSGTSLTILVTNTGGSGTFTDWVIGLSGTQGPAGATPVMSTPVSPKSAAYTIVSTDRGSLFDCTGSFTLSIAAASSLGVGFSTFVRNSGTGAVTLTPTGADTVDGRTSLRLYPGESLTLISTGTVYVTVGRERRVLISNILLAAAASAIDTEIFAGDAELSSLEYELYTLSASSGLLYKLGGSYVADGTTYSSQFINGLGSSAGGNKVASTQQVPASIYYSAKILGINSTTAGAVKAFLQWRDDNSNGLVLSSVQNSTAGAFGGFRIAAPTGSFGIGTTLKVWANR